MYLKTTRSISLVSFPLMIGLLAVAEPFVMNVFGPNWAEVIPILQIFSMMGLVQSIGTTVGWIYTSQGRTDIMFRWTLFAGTVYVIAFLIGMHWGIVGIATAYVLSGYTLLWYPSWTIAGRLIDLRFLDMAKNLAGTFFCSAAMGGTVWGIARILPFPVKGWMYLLTLIASGAGIYFVLIRLFRIRAYQELLEIFHERVRVYRNEKKRPKGNHAT